MFECHAMRNSLARARLARVRGVVVFTLALFGSASLLAEGEGGFAIPVEAVTLQPQQIDETLHAVGSLRADESVVLKPELGGRIERFQQRFGRASQEYHHADL